MTAQPAPSNHPVFLLAEHLDMILAAIEDLESCKVPETPGDPQRPGDESRASIADYVRQLHVYEMAAIGHVGRARNLTRELVRRDSRFAMLGGLFVGGTAALDEAVARMRDTAGRAFRSGGDPLVYLRSRGMVDAEAGSVRVGDISVGEGFGLAGEIEIGPLGELVSTFLNTIELHFDLFPDLMDTDDVARAKGELVS